MVEILLVGVGGALGAISRFGVGKIIASPASTILINITGSCLIGFLVGLGLNNTEKNSLWSFGAIGFCGGFTTFSTFSLEAVQLLQSGRFLIGIIYLLSNIIGCGLGVFCGIIIGRWLIK